MKHNMHIAGFLGEVLSQRQRINDRK